MCSDQASTIQDRDHSIAEAQSASNAPFILMATALGVQFLLTFSSGKQRVEDSLRALSIRACKFVDSKQ